MVLLRARALGREQGGIRYGFTDPSARTAARPRLITRIRPQTSLAVQSIPVQEEGSNEVITLRK